MTPLFTVIVLSYCSGRYLKTVLDSILTQDYPALELIVSDDGTPNFDSAAVEQQIAQRGGDRLVRYAVLAHAENLGTVASFNRAVQEAKGQYIKVIAADDALYDAQTLSNAARVFQESGAEIIAARVMKCDKEMRPIAPMGDRFLRGLAKKNAGQVWRRLCIHNALPAAGIFFSRTFFERYGLVDSRYRLLEDWPTWLRATRQGCGIVYGGFLAAKYRADSGSATGLRPAYLRDKELTFETEIRPYRKRLGFTRYMAAICSLRVRNSRMLRRIYGRIRR